MPLEHPRLLPFHGQDSPPPPTQWGCPSPGPPHLRCKATACLQAQIRTVRAHASEAASGRCPQIPASRGSAAPEVFGRQRFHFCGSPAASQAGADFVARHCEVPFLRDRHRRAVPRGRAGSPPRVWHSPPQKNHEMCLGSRPRGRTHANRKETAISRARAPCAMRVPRARAGPAESVVVSHGQRCVSLRAEGDPGGVWGLAGFSCPQRPVRTACAGPEWVVLFLPAILPTFGPARRHQ